MEKIGGTFINADAARGGCPQWRAKSCFHQAKEVLANNESEFVSIHGMDVHYRREGNGFPIVLVHGTSAILQTWNGWTEELVKNGYEVIRVDLPAFGLTGAHPEHNYTIPYYVSFMESFTNALGVDSFHLAGNSLGGLIAWEYAVDHQQKLGKLILVDPAGIKGEKDKKNKKGTGKGKESSNKEIEFWSAVREIETKEGQ